jgi:hypothetical protein
VFVLCTTLASCADPLLTPALCRPPSPPLRPPNATAATVHSIEGLLPCNPLSILSVALLMGAD